MRFGVLGPLTVTSRHGAVPVTSARQRRLLAALVVDADRVVSADRLIDIVFEGDPPRAAATTIRSYVARLRRVLAEGEDGADELVVTEPPGYRLHIGADDIDVARFEAAIDTARRHVVESDPISAVDVLREGLDLWRGEAYDEFAYEDWARGEALRLDELKTVAQEDLNDALLACGLAHDVVSTTRGLIDRHPLRERVRAQYMLALYRTGRQVEALRTLDSFQAELVEVGLEPSDKLVKLGRSIADHDPALRLDSPAGQPLRGYRVGAALGEGRHGVVYRAVQPGVGREVAIKTIRAQLADDPNFVRRFDAEAQLIANLEHPHIVPVYDYWREPGGAYIVMRLVDESLNERLDGPMNIETVSTITRQLGSALATAHRAGVVHGDIKPGNVLVDSENAYLADFGLAAIAGTDPDSTPSSSSSGYEAPETLAGEPPSPASDQFAFAVLVVQLLTGILSFGVRAIATRHDRAPSVHAQRPSIPAQVDEVLWKATAWKPQDRYDDVASFVDHFEAALEGQSSPTRSEAPQPNPYKGLNAFTEADRQDFHGRTAIVDELLAALDRPGPPGRFVAVVGASGSGKSSVVRAGLIPSLRAGGVPGSADWFTVTMVPGSEPFAELEAALRSVAAGDIPPREAIVDDNEFSRILRAAVPEDRAVFLVIDQLEELFTLVDNEATRRAFLTGLARAVVDPTSNLRVVATLRADFLDRPLRFHDFGRLIKDGTVTVVGMTARELGGAITEPAAGVAVEVQPALVTQIVTDVIDQPAALPLLQFTLTELFERRSGPVMTLSSYDELGGVEAAVAGRTEALLEQLPAGDTELARRLFLRLVTIDSAGLASSHRSSRSDLLAVADDPDEMERILRSFGDARLLTFDREPTSRIPTVEVAHEALLSHWPRLGQWISDAGQSLRVQHQVAEAAHIWDAQGRDDSDLLRGVRLDSALEWVARHDEAPSPLERQYVESSGDLREAEEQAERRTNRRLRLLLSCVGIAFVVALIAGVLAFDQRNSARTNERFATVRELVAASAANLSVDPELSMLLALEAVDLVGDDDLPEAEQALHDAVLATRLVARVPGSPEGIAEFFPDGRSFITGDGDDPGTLVRWTVDPVEPIVTFTGVEAPISDAVVDPDGTRVATATFDEKVRIWDAETGELRLVIELDPGVIPAVPVFSNDGSMVAATTFDRGDTPGAVVWDADTGEVLHTLPAPPDTTEALNVEFSPDDRILAVTYFVTDEGIPGVRTWDLETEELIRVYAGHDADVTDVGFTPDGTRLVTASIDATAKVWDIATGRLLGTFPGNDGPLRDIEISADGSTVATAGLDVQVWDLATFEPVVPIVGHTAVDGLDFSPDGRFLLTSSHADQTTRLWDLTPEGSHEVAGFPGPLSTLESERGGFVSPPGGVAFAPDGEHLAANRGNGKVTVWHMASGSEVRTMNGPGGEIISVAYSPSGAWLGAAGGGGLTVWSTDTFGAVTPRRVTSPVTDLSFVADDDAVLAAGEGGIDLVALPSGEATELWRDAVDTATVSRDGSTVVLSNIDLRFGVLIDGITGAWKGDLAPDDGDPYDQPPVRTVSFSADDRLVAIGRFEPSIEVWDMDDRQLLHRFEVSTAPVWDTAFAPDGQQLATVSGDGEIHLWDLERGTARLTFTRPGATDVAFSPDSGRLAVLSVDGSVTVFFLELDQLVAEAQRRLARLGRTWTTVECAQYLRSECPGEAGPTGPIVAAEVPVDEVDTSSTVTVAITDGPEIERVLAAYEALNTGDRDAYLALLNDDLFVFERETSVSQIWINAGRRTEILEPCRIIEQTPAGHSTVECLVRVDDDYFGPAGMEYIGPEWWVVDNQAKISSVDNGGELRRIADLGRWFWPWLREAHPDVYEAIEPNDDLSVPGWRRDPADMLVAIQYMDEFVAQSDVFPIDPADS